MRIVVLIAVFLLIWCVSTSTAGMVDPASLPPEKVDFTLLSYSPVDDMDASAYLFVPADGLPPEDFSEKLKNGRLPERFVSRLRALHADDNLFLYVFAPEDPDTPELTQTEFPLQELADLLNNLPCKYVVTIIDLPTKAKYENPTVQDITSMAARCRMFTKGMTIFTSRQFEPRLMYDEYQSTFAYYFSLGLYTGHANADEDHNVTLWEAYSYAYWCTYARAAKRLWSLQCAVYVLTENWTAQPVLNSSVYYYYPQADEQRILFAEASGRKPIGGILGPLGPTSSLNRQRSFPS